MPDADDDFNDLEDDDLLDALYQKNINKTVTETRVRRSLPVQRDLTNQILPGQRTFYEEIQREVTFGPTHHAFNEEELPIYIYPTNYEVREYQFDIVRKALYTNVLCAIPTGMGKTFIASTVMLNYFRWTKTAKIIFMAPTRPLVAQQIKACLGITGIPSNETAILLDKTRKNREEIWKMKRVFFTTPQVVENDLKRGVLNPKDIVCLVIDEAHRATGSYAYTNVVKFMDRFVSSYRILALTATPGAALENVQEVINNLNISKIEIRTEESMDIAKYMKHREKEQIQVALSAEIEEILEQLGIAILPVLNQAVELGIYEECHPSRINAFKAMQLSQKIIANPSIPEGIKWRNFFILQLLNHFGQMMKRIKIYGIRTFYSYFQNKYKEFTTKFNLGKSTNKIAAGFYFHPILKNVMKQCDKYLNDPQFLGHDKLQHVRDQLETFLVTGRSDSRVIIFTELRESALEIVKCVDSMNKNSIRPHIFIGQARGKEDFDEVSFTRKHQPKGRKKGDKLKRKEEEEILQIAKKRKKEQEKLEREGRRTGSSEDAQINGMSQKQQKEVIQQFKNGDFNVLVCTSIGEEGLDIGEVDLIICYDTTSSPIKNIQRMGRTGRKREGHILLLFSSNESYKFEQAMTDYSNLQKLISQEYVECKPSDRILPTDRVPECHKTFIAVNEEDEELTRMDDTDEVIRYATQCMLGKKTRPKKKATNGKQKTVKQFFMPDNVEVGIISADQLVNKFTEAKSGEKIKIPKKIESRKRKKPLKALDDLENDSLESSGDELDDIKKPRIEMVQPQITNQKAEKNLQTELKISVKKESPISSRNIPIEPSLFKNPVKTEPKPYIEENPIISANDKIDKNFYSSNEGLLNEEEKSYFKQYYVPEDAVSMELAPNFNQWTESGSISHTLLNQNVITTFKSLKNNDKSKIIEMNRMKCIVRNMQNKNARPTKQTKSDINTKIEDSSKNLLPGQKEVNNSSPSTNKELLNDILESDSDFE
ncbi:hypothetical protein KAFR_0K01070 [Kazachstania africana CBS 2517]|uniref:ATP-dependent DNA helicase n=1 Tax=Kazachstania africana (strain ATCC 22294 / BCRC 22015 / CBS 2517 / CECT 1963 / NBRC 1671 / NRRL Y-8276) TaxID=1071382 RepID=H2B1G3_KAZAF|nr:hypothetical protein KAFR_0K01070 [Kazachstania africana CBS 2517]CCF60463.1 hypothetical protein KAFR_0K01070 [Kazachstania africana CBS 2517]